MRLKAAVAIVLLVATPAAGITFSDGTFASENWTTTILTFNHAGASTGQSTSGGNPGSHRLITTFQANPGESRVIVIEMRAGAVVDPSTLGGIADVNYFEDHKCSSADGCTGAGQGWSPAIRQAGKFYIVSPPIATTGVVEGWTSVAAIGLTAADFNEVVVTSTADTDPSSHPNFMASGQPVQFGYARTNRKNSQRTGRLDNWSVSITGVIVPVEPVSWGYLKEIYR